MSFYQLKYQENVNLWQNTDGGEVIPAGSMVDSYQLLVPNMFPVSEHFKQFLYVDDFSWRSLPLICVLAVLQQ